MPHRAPGSPDQNTAAYLSGQVITYYRPRGSADVRHLIKGVDQAPDFLFCSDMILSENWHPSVGPRPEDKLFGIML